MRGMQKTLTFCMPSIDLGMVSSFSGMEDGIGILCYENKRRLAKSQACDGLFVFSDIDFLLKMSYIL